MTVFGCMNEGDRRVEEALVQLAPL